MCASLLSHRRGNHLLFSTKSDKRGTEKMDSFPREAVVFQSLERNKDGAHPIWTESKAFRFEGGPLLSKGLDLDLWRSLPT